MYLGLIETQGNQSFIFSTNRERANRGASELLFRSTTDWVIDAVSGEKKQRTLTERANWLRAQGPLGSSIHVVVATSGRAVVLSQTRQELESLISKITTRAIKDAPGLSIAGAIAEYDSQTVRSIPQALDQCRQRLGRNVSRISPAAARAQGIPPMQECLESGLPANKFEKSGDGRPISRQVIQQLEAARSSWRRIDSIVPLGFAENVDSALSEHSWRAVMHADGNGVGKILMGLTDALAPSSLSGHEGNQNYVEGYREFSLALEKATEDSFRDASSSVQIQSVMPILLGGDDVIVQMNARVALKFTREYLKAFERNTRSVVDVLKKYAKGPIAVAGDHFTSCAGLAYVKAHYPFSSASELAGELLDNAKLAKDEGRASAFDVHVSYDSTISQLSQLRKQRVNADGVHLYGGPYVISGSVVQANSDDILDQTIATLGDIGTGTQVHSMRDAVRRSQSALDQAIENARHVQGKFAREFEEIGRVHNGSIVFIDALEIMDVEKGGRK